MSTVESHPPNRSEPVKSAAIFDKNRPTVCVFCGASPGTSPAHLAAARELARAFNKHGVQLVYGGGTLGVMGELARTLVGLSGPDAVHGVIPRALLKHERNPGAGHGDAAANGAEDGTPDQTTFGRTTVVPDMHTRKQLMARQVIESGAGSGFVALSGGYGTLEELMEVTTWNQLGIHARGVALFNVDGYWDGILQWVQTAVNAGFVAPGNAGIMVEATSAEEVLQKLRDYRNAEARFKLQWEEK